MPRYFIAIPLPDEARERLVAVQPPAVPGMRILGREELHLTLHFLGEVAAQDLDKLRTALATLRRDAFTIALNGIGKFQQEGRPQVLWAGVEANKDLTALHRSIGAALADAIDFHPEERPYSPHITLARLNGPVPPDVIDRYLQEAKDFLVSSVPIDRFVLYSSDFADDVPHYREEAMFPLLKRASLSEYTPEEGRLGRLDDSRRTTVLYDALVPDLMIYSFVEELDAKVAALQLPHVIDTKNETYGREFLFYLLFTHALLPLDMDAVEVFYNRYYWFRRFMEGYQTERGLDAGLEQQAFQMLEQAR